MPREKLYNTQGDTNRYKRLSEDTSFKKKARKFDLSNQIMQMITVSDQTEILLKKKKDYAETVNRFLGYDGQKIRSITFKQLPIFGQNGIDSSHNPENHVETLINELHFNTRRQILANKLLIKPGDKVNSFVLADNERLYRELPYIHDARININKNDSINDSIDLTIITKDVFPVGFGGEISNLESGNIGVWNKNLIGYGHEINYRLLWNFTEVSHFGQSLTYRINNIGKTFVSANASYENYWGNDILKVNFNRDFFTPQTKYAGGAGFMRSITFNNYRLPDSVPVGYYYYDFWTGRAIQINSNNESKIRNDLALTGRITRYSFFQRPPVTESLLYAYHSRTLMLGSLSLSRQAFVQTKLVYGFGKPEDLPYGMLYSVTAGYEINEFNARPYIGSSFSFGSYIDNLGYYYQEIDFGSFIKSGIQQGVMSFSGKYFTRLLNPMGKYRYRVFTRLDYEAGLNRMPDEYIELGNNNGIRGLSTDSLQGNQRLYFNLEGDCYSPHKIFGFHFTYFLFLDAGIIGNNNINFYKNNIYSGIGAGVRIRNENLVFNTIQIRLAYYPTLPPDSRETYINFSGLGNITFNDFANKKPDIAGY